MATFVLIHGAAGSSWYWHLLEPELRERGHEVVSMDLPTADDSAGLAEYVETVVDAGSGTPLEKPWPLEKWPDVPTTFLLSRDDRFFPPDFIRRVVTERLGITPDEIDGGHLVALSRPKELAERLDSYVAGSRA